MAVCLHPRNRQKLPGDNKMCWMHEPGASVPDETVVDVQDGDVFFDTDTPALFFYYGGSWYASTTNVALV